MVLTPGCQLTGLQGDEIAEVGLLKTVNGLVVFVHFAGPVHGAELGSAHGAEGGFLVVVVGKGFIVHGPGCFRVNGEGELLFPIEGVASVADGVVAVAGDVSGVCGDFIGNHAVLYVFLVGQAEVLFGRDVAEHGSAVPSNEGRADGGGDVIVAGSDIGDQRPESVEGRAVAVFDFLIHLLLDFVERNVARAFDHDLNVAFPGFLGEFTQGFELGKLGLVGSVGHAAWTQAIAEGEADVVFRHDLYDAVEVFIQEVLLVVVGHPLGEDGAATADDSGDALCDHGDVLNQDAGVDGKVVYALLGLLFDDLKIDINIQVFELFDAVEGLVDGHCSDGNGGMAQNGFADFRNVAAGGEIHDGVGAKLYGHVQLTEFLINVGGHGRVADIGVDFAPGRNANGHWFQLRMVDVCRNDESACSDFRANELRGEVFAFGDELHFLGDDAFARKVHLGDVVVSGTRGL